MMPHMDLRMSVLAAYQDPKASLGQPFDPRISFMGRPLDQRFSFTSPPAQIDPRFSINSNEMNYSNVSSLRNEKSNAYTDQIRLSSIRSKSLSGSPSAKSSESDNSDETSSSSKDGTGTESTSGEDDSSCTSSSNETNENLIEQLEDKESIGSSSVTSSDDDSENSKSPTAALNLVPITYLPYPSVGTPLVPPSQQYSEGQYLSQYLGSNFPVPPRRQESKSVASKSNTVSSSSGSEEEVHNLHETANSDSGTESESSISADESSVKKKSRSVLLPGKP